MRTLGRQENYPVSSCRVDLTTNTPNSAVEWAMSSTIVVAYQASIGPGVNFIAAASALMTIIENSRDIQKFSLLLSRPPLSLEIFKSL